jgi:hypothetical protein
LTSNGAITVEIYEPLSGRVELFVTGIALSDVQTSRAIAQVIGELRAELMIAQLQGSGKARSDSTRSSRDGAG